MAKKYLKKIKYLIFFIIIFVFFYLISDLVKKYVYQNLNYNKYDHIIHQTYILNNYLSQRPLWIAVGGSTVRETFLENFKSSKIISEICMRNIDFLNIGTSGQSLTESFALIESFEKLNNVERILFQVNVNRMNFNTKKNSLFLDYEINKNIYEKWKKILFVPFKNLKEVIYILNKYNLKNKKSLEDIPSNHNSTYKNNNKIDKQKLDSVIAKRRIRIDIDKEKNGLDLLKNFFKKNNFTKQKLIFIITPELQNRVKDNKYKTLDDNLKSYFQNNFENKFINLSNMLNSENYFYDDLHLNGDGKKAFIKNLRLNKNYHKILCQG